LEKQLEEAHVIGDGQEAHATTAAMYVGSDRSGTALLRRDCAFVAALAMKKANRRTERIRFNMAISLANQGASPSLSRNEAGVRKFWGFSECADSRL
jgi:hypothetical protein